jgi:hypothetical protein
MEPSSLPSSKNHAEQRHVLFFLAGGADRAYVFFVCSIKTAPELFMCGTRRILERPKISSLRDQHHFLLHLIDIERGWEMCLWCYLSLLSASKLMRTIVMCLENQSLTDHASRNAFPKKGTLRYMSGGHFLGETKAQS